MRKLNLIFQAIVLAIFGSFSNIDSKSEDLGLSIEMLPWEKVNEILPNKSYFTIMDVGTGKRFHAQRRAGSRHADVQPITKQDTKIMKEIYNGEWGWKRRAIIVMSEGRWIAASMHGMPHGAGSLDNNFPGHFCVHFYGSTTHLTGKMDLSHKLMIYKAAGKLEAFINNQEPADIVKAFITGLKQHDTEILINTTNNRMDWNKIIKEIMFINLTDIKEDPKNEFPLFRSYEIELKWINKINEKGNYQGKIRLVRSSPTDPWKIDNVKFLHEAGILMK